MDDKSKISVLLSPEQFARFNAYCSEKGYKKGTLIRRLIREHMDAEGFQFQAPASDARTGSSRRSARKGG